MSQASLFVLHGGLLAGSCEVLESAATLRAQYAVHRVARPGYPGGPSLAIGMDMPAQVAQVLRVADEAGHAQVDLLGYSIGGAIALAVAIAAPARVRFLTLLDPPLPSLVPSGAAFVDGLSALPAMRASMSDASLARAIIGGSIGADTLDARPSLLGDTDVSVDEALAASLVAFVDGDLPAWATWDPEVSALQALRMPIRLLGGGESEPLYRESCALLRASCPQVSYTEISGVGHAMHLAQPTAVLDALTVVALRA